jgi:uncharacterized protein YbjT (DUF2867 family)
MSIVVTGATGHLGRLIVEGLLREGVAPAGIVAGGRSVEKLADLGERGVTDRLHRPRQPRLRVPGRRDPDARFRQ